MAKSKAVEKVDSQKVTVLLPSAVLGALARERARRLEAGARLSEVTLTGLIIEAVTGSFK